MIKKCVLPVVCLALLVWMIVKAGPMQLWQNLLEWNWAILGCIIVWGLGYVLNTMSFGSILSCYKEKEGSENLSWKSIFRLTVGGYALNYITPMGLLGGEPWRIYQLRKVLTPQSANSAVAYYALMHVVSHILFWTISLMLCIAGQEIQAIGQSQVLSVVLGMIGLVLVLALVIFVLQRKGWISNLRHLLSEHPKQFWMSLGWELASRLVNVLEFWLLLEVAFPAEMFPSYKMAYLVVAVSSLVANVLFFSPMQMGTREGGIMLALQWLLPACLMPDVFPMAVSISFATRIRELFWIVVGLLLIYIKK